MDEVERDSDQSDSKKIKLEKWQSQPASVHNFSCHKCPKHFRTPEDIIDHWTEVHGLRPASCCVCNAPFPTISEMWDHKVDVHGIPCELCESYFDTDEKLMDHVKSVHLINSNLEKNGNNWTFDTFEVPVSVDPFFSCHLCPMTLKTTHGMKHHWSMKHNLKPVVCGFCNKLFASLLLKHEHKIAVHGITCPICNKNFPTQNNGFEDHMREIHGLVKPRYCTICGLVFPKSKLLCLETRLKKHVVAFHSDVQGVIKQCGSCEHISLTEEEMIKHKEKHMSPVISVFPSKGAVKRHRPGTKQRILSRN